MLLLTPLPGAAELGPEALAQLDAYVPHAREVIGIPAVAVAVVRDATIVFEKGYGTRDAATGDAVTPRTTFRIASVSKPLGSLVVAALVDRGVLDWDSRARDLMPGFPVGGHDFAREVRVQDLLCLCSGLPEIIVGTDFSRAGLKPEALLAWMGSHTPTEARGARFQYSNESFSAGVYVAAHAAYPALPMQEAFDAALRAGVLGPLAMDDTGVWPRGHRAP